MPKAAPILTKRRVFLGLLAAGTVSTAILLLGPDTRRSLLEGSPYGAPVDRDIEEIRKDTLRVLVVDHHLVYERIDAAETGLAYEIMKRIAGHLKLPIKAVLVADGDSLVPKLQRGEGDVIAAQLNPRSAMARWVSTTIPFRHVSPVMVILREDPLLGITTSPEEPDTAWISAWSPFAPAERRFIGQEVEEHSGRVLFTDTSSMGDAPVMNVALGRVKAAVVSDVMAVYCAERFPQVQFSAPIDRPVPLTFGVRTSSPRLRRALDRELSDPKEKEALTMLMYSYGGRWRERPSLGQWSAMTTGIDPLLPTDERARLKSMSRVRNWELLAAIAFQQLRGSEQEGEEAPLMPNQAQRAADGDTAEVPAQIRAAARYLAALDTIWSRSIPDPDQRLRFVVAAYHAGPGHVVDAQTLATELGMNATHWEGDVERTMTLLALPRYFNYKGVNSGPWRGDRTFLFVRNTVGLYEHYRSAASAVQAWRP